MTLYPFLCNSIAIAAPIPLVPPVTIANLFFISSITPAIY